MTSSAPAPRTWTNWVGNQTFTPRDIVAVKDEAEARHWVAEAAARGWGVRTFGTGHSFTPVVETGGLLLDTAAVFGIVET
jgi:FAD/FMN-containing dehydrogenase